MPESLIGLREAAPAELATPVERVFLQAPHIVLSEQIVESNEELFTIRGHVRDDNTVRDFYLVQQTLVGPRQTRSLKRSYSYVNEAATELNEQVSLSPGMNRITIVARDDMRAVSTYELFVYRHND
jgi:hypothetical protein